MTSRSEIEDRLRQWSQHFTAFSGTMRTDLLEAATALDQAQARIAELEKLLQRIISLDDDAHPGLMTWHDFRVRAHQDAKAAIQAERSEGS